MKSIFAGLTNPQRIKARIGSHLQTAGIWTQIRGKHRRSLVILATLLAALAPIQFSAQITSGAVAGTITDPAKAVVNDASISLTNEETGITQTTHSTSIGTYAFAIVPVGTYTLRAELAGFKEYVETGIQIHIQNTVTADIHLTLGNVAQQVTVTSDVPLLQAQDASLGQTVPAVQVNDLPLNGRSWLSLQLLAAGAVTNPGASPDNPTSGASVNGADQSQTDYRLNGIDDNGEIFGVQYTGTFGGPTVTPIPDAIQEFKLQDGDNDAEFGRFNGAVVNAVLKSGTNRISGELFEYLRNQLFNANDYFYNLNDKARPPYRQNQLGGTLGGPIYIPKLYNGKDKTFFFVDYQHTGLSQSFPFTTTVPTNLMQSSDFKNLQDLINDNSGSNTDALGRTFSFGTVLDPETTRSVAAGAVDPVSGFTNSTSSTVYVRDPFYTGGSILGIKSFTNLASQLNMIPSTRLDPNGVKLLQQLPPPTTNGLTNDRFSTSPATTTINQYDVRVDENISQKDLLWGAFSRSDMNASSYQPFPGIAGGALSLSPQYSEPHYEFALNYTHVFSAKLENDMTGGYDHLINDYVLPTSNTLGLPAEFNIQGIQQMAGNGGLPTIDYGDFTSFGGRRYVPTIMTITGLQYLDNLIYSRGRHDFKAGFEFDHMRGNMTQPSYSRGEFDWTGAYSNIPNKNNSYTGIADMLLVPGAARVPNGISNLGGLSSYLGSNFAGTQYLADYYGVYAQDNWRITSSLTLNLGLRWEYFSPYAENNGWQANFNATGGNGNSGIYYIPEKGCAVARSAAFNTLLSGYNIQVDCVPGLAVNQTQKDNFAPRLGFAYRIRPTLVVRGGYGIAYGAFDNVGYGSTMGTNYPFQFLINSPGLTSQTPDYIPNTTTVATMESTFGGINLQNPSSVTGAGLSLFGKQYDYTTPRTESLNLTIQYQFTGRDSIQVGYVGSLGRDLDAFGDANAPSEILPPSVSQTSYLPFPTLAAKTQFLQPIARSNYNSLQTVYQHQFKDNLVLLGNYTWSKCLSNEAGKTDLTSGSFRAEWLPGFGIGRDYSYCASDAAQVVHVSGEYALPFGRGRQFVKNANRVLDELIAGWNVNYIFSYQSGQPFTVGCPVATTSDFGCNANLISGQNPYAGPHNRTQWLNPSAFAQPPAATTIGQVDFSPLGSSGDQVRGPGFTNLDSSIFKEFAMWESSRLEFRAEFFNTLNHPEFGNPGQLNFTNRTAFSSITSDRTNSYRIGQLALKVSF